MIIDRKLKIIFAGGGTGGHFFPALAIADEFRKLQPDAEIHFVGTKYKIESRIAPEQGYPFHAIWISGFKRNFTPGNLMFPLKVAVSMAQAFSLMRTVRPHAVVGTGGYVSGPVLYAATCLKIPTLIQEQNSFPGVTTRMLASRVNEVHVTFEDSKKYFRRTDHVHVTGNPTRNNLSNVSRADAMKYFGFDGSERKKTALIVGGSLGAHSINGAVAGLLDQLFASGLRIIWQTGKEDYDRMKNLSEKYSRTNIWVNAFIDRMDYAYAASDFVICRAGATTIAELTRLGKPSILVPYPHAAANHQVENGRSLAGAGAAAIVYDHEISEKLLPAVRAMLEGNRLAEMSVQAKKLGTPDAASIIAGRVVQMASEYAARMA